jgi:hypothetical protein
MPPSDQCHGAGQLQIVRHDDAGGARPCSTASRDAEDKTASENAVSVTVWPQGPMATEVLLDDHKNRSLTCGPGGYRVIWTPDGLQFRPEPTTPPDMAEDARRRGDLEKPEYARVLRSLAVAVVGWPGETVIRRGLVVGQDTPEVQLSLQAMAAVQLQGRPALAEVTTRFQSRSREPWGDVDVFAVTLSARASSPEAKCGNGPRELQATGELVVRATDEPSSCCTLAAP